VNRVFIWMLVCPLFFMPFLASANPMWRVSLSNVSTYNYANRDEWVKGTGIGSLEVYTPPEPVITTWVYVSINMDD